MRARLFVLALTLAGPALAGEPARGRLYVPVYSSIAAGSGATRIDMTATLSLRNLSARHAVTLERVEYRDTAGALVRGYLKQPLAVAPLGAYEAVIPDKDLAGGTGAKFLIDWIAPAGAPAPIAEAVMLGSVGSVSYSFVSVGRPAPQD